MPLFGLGPRHNGGMRQMRLLKLLPCLVLGGCSSFLDDIPEKPDPAPFISSSIADLTKVAADEKLAKPLEVAGPIAANSISIAPWIICLRSVATEQARKRVYSVFFKDDKVSSVRESVFVDHCEAQTFTPLPDIAPSPAATNAAKNGPKPAQSGSSRSQ
jgi:hypothetical protein